jgi:hypothetical protein
MLKPTFRLFIIPLGAICTLASLSSQNVTPRAPHGQQVIDCGNKNPAQICVISFDSDTSAR